MGVLLEGSAYRACPAHYRPGSADDLDCRNFRKPNISSAAPVHRVLHPTLSKLWARVEDRPHYGDSVDHTSFQQACRFVLELQMDHEAHTLAGAPEKLVVGVNISNRTIAWDVVQVNKRPTRLPEAEFFSFRPMTKASATKGWRVQVLGSEMQPTDVLGSEAGTNTTYGGSPHLRGVELVSWSDGEPTAPQNRSQPAIDRLRQMMRPVGFTISSLDVPVVSMGKASPFPTPRNTPPNMSNGVHFNIQNNLWNTK